MSPEFEEFVRIHMQQEGRLAPVRVQTALALLEGLRDSPSLELGGHLSSKGSSGLKSPENLNARAHTRLGLELINKNYGGRSACLQFWGQDLLDRLKEANFENLPGDDQGSVLDSAQVYLADRLRNFLEQEPLEIRTRGWTAEAVVGDLLRQAEQKGRAADVARYLVGAKLTLRLGREIPVQPVNKGDRKSYSDRDARLGDFEIGDTVIEVALGLPDEKHIAQIEAVLEQTDSEVWLLTQADRAEAWRSELAQLGESDLRRIVVGTVEAFVGQNIAQLAGFTNSGRASQFELLIEIYNSKWVDQVGHRGIRVAIR